MSKLGIKTFLVGPAHTKKEQRHFYDVESRLVKEGYEVVNPMRAPVQNGWGLIEWLCWMLSTMETCDELLLLRGSYTELINEEGKTLAFQWHSIEAQIMYVVALRLGIDVFSEELTGKGGHL